MSESFCLSLWLTDLPPACARRASSESRAILTKISSLLRYENGRRYHAYHAGKYPLPNDDMEQDRLDMMHHLYLLSYNGELYRAPLVQGRVRRALDIGCGTGIVCLLSSLSTSRMSWERSLTTCAC
jgi:hypothetical protein